MQEAIGVMEMLGQRFRLAKVWPLKNDPSYWVVTATLEGKGGTVPPVEVMRPDVEQALDWCADVAMGLRAQQRAALLR